MFDLSGWTYLFTLQGIKLYARGQERIGIDPQGNPVVKYTR